MFIPSDLCDRFSGYYEETWATSIQYKVDSILEMKEKLFERRDHSNLIMEISTSEVFLQQLLSKDVLSRLGLNRTDAAFRLFLAEALHEEPANFRLSLLDETPVIY